MNSGTAVKGVIAASVTAAALVALYMLTKPKKNDRKGDVNNTPASTNETAESTSASTPTPAAEPTPSAGGSDSSKKVEKRPSQKELLSQSKLEDSLKRFNADPMKAKFTSEDKRIKNTLLNELKYEDDALAELTSTVRILAAEWLITASMLGHLFEKEEKDALTHAQMTKEAAEAAKIQRMAVDGEELLKSVNKVRTYMKKAWALLKVEVSEPQELRARDFLRLDVAGKLKNGAKMRECFNRLREKTKLTMEEVMSLFANAPLLGRWTDMLELGQHINSKEAGSLEVFHYQALNTPSVIDFSALYELVKEDIESNEGAEADKSEKKEAEELVCQTYTVKEMKMKLDQKQDQPLDSNPNLVELLKTFKDWHAIPEQDNVHLHRIGKAAHWVNPGAIPIPLAGKFEDDCIKLKGYIDMGDENGQLRHWETYELRPDPERPGIWQGVDRVVQKKISGSLPERSCQSFAFRIQLRLEKDDGALWKVL
eukprot:GFYU01007399.1.p1 GENE.GFYU01007399.1~~GFYU01007399.1.p1  ORF type:complete len:483 (-),score=188.93 GFYU01007399.1:291-1739(-)